jgi:hypothetical protein
MSWDVHALHELKYDEEIQRMRAVIRNGS